MRLRLPVMSGYVRLRGRRGFVHVFEQVTTRRHLADLTHRDREDEQEGDRATVVDIDYESSAGCSLHAMRTGVIPGKLRLAGVSAAGLHCREVMRRQRRWPVPIALFGFEFVIGGN